MTDKKRRWFRPLLLSVLLLLIGGAVGALGANYVIDSDDDASKSSSDSSSSNGDKNGGDASSTTTTQSEDNQGTGPTGGGSNGGTSTITVSNLTSGGGTFKPNPTDQTTESIAPQGGGTLLVWVGTAAAGTDESPVPTVSGLGLTFDVVEAIQKKDNAPRRFTLLSAPVPSDVGSGPLTISHSEPVAHWAWAVDLVSSANLVRSVTRTDGGLVTDYSVAFDPPTKKGNVVVAGLMAGTNGDIDAGAGLTKLGQGASTYISTMSEWSEESRNSMDFEWATSSGEAAHCQAIAVEFAP